MDKLLLKLINKQQMFLLLTDGVNTNTYVYMYFLVSSSPSFRLSF